MLHCKPINSLKTFCGVLIHPRILKGSHYCYISLTDINQIDCPECQSSIKNLHSYYSSLDSIPYDTDGRSVLIDIDEDNTGYCLTLEELQNPLFSNPYCAPQENQITARRTPLGRRR